MLAVSKRLVGRFLLRRGRCLADFWDASVALEMLVNSPAAQLHNNTTLCICICITPCHLFNDVLLQRDKSRRRSAERIYPVLQSSRKRNRLAGHPPSSVFLASARPEGATRARVVQVPRSSVFPCLRMPSCQLFICHRYWTTRSCTHSA